MAEPSHAVFLSYASEDTLAAQGICEALRAAGIEVWFDQSELRGGDAWDHAIRSRIKNCALFIALISRHTHDRDEGYFRLEWKLAVDRCHLMAADRTFLLPVAVDDTRDDDERVPDRFREVQWTRLRGGATPPEFVARVQRLLNPAPVAATRAPAAGDRTLPPPNATASWRKPAWPIVLAVLAAVAAYGFFGKAWIAKRALGVQPAASTAAAPAAVAIQAAAKSIAVLPLEDMSEKHDQAYFTDGLTEEIINRLSQAADLKVIARTSSFQFKGKNEDVRSIAAKLGVAHLIEGSVRKLGNDVRVTVQLIRAADGTHLWSQNYDRQLRNSFKVQDEIAEAVARQLSVSLRPATRAAPVMSPAYTLFLQGREISESSDDEAGMQRGLALLESAVRLDPTLAVAWAELSRMRLALLLDFPRTAARDATRERAMQEAQLSLKLSPDLAEGHIALARILMFLDWDWGHASSEIRRALQLGPGNANVARNSVYLSMFVGRWDEALERARKATELDPLDKQNFLRLSDAQVTVGDLKGAEASLRTAFNLSLNAPGSHSSLAWLIWLQGRREAALAENSQEPSRIDRLAHDAIFLHLLGREAEAERALSEVIRSWASSNPYGLGDLYAARHQPAQAISWWARAIEQRDPSAAWLLPDVQWPGAYDFSSDPGFQALLRKLRLRT